MMPLASTPLPDVLVRAVAHKPGLRRVPQLSPALVALCDRTFAPALAAAIAATEEGV